MLARRRREKLPSFAPPSLSLLRYYYPRFLFSRHFSLLRSDFSRHFYTQRTGAISKGRVSSCFLRRETPRILFRRVSFEQSSGNFFDHFVEWTSTVFCVPFFCLAEIFMEDYESWTRVNIFYLNISCGYFVLLCKRGEKLFSLEYAKAEYLFICLFIYLYSTLYVFC